MASQPRRSINGVLPCQTISPVFGLLRNEGRRAVLCHLFNRELDVSTLAGNLQLDLAYVSAALGELRSHGLVESRDQRRRRLYRVSPRVALRTRGEFVHLSVTAINGEMLSITLRSSCI